MRYHRLRAPAPAASAGAPLSAAMAEAVTSSPAASVADALGRLAEAGLAACTLWLPVAAEHVEKAMEWFAAEVVPRLA